MGFPENYIKNPDLKSKLSSTLKNRFNMKKLILLICLIACFLPQTNIAQSENTLIGTSNLSKLYLNGGYGLSSGRLTGLGLNFIYLNNWGFSLSYNKFETPAKNLPSNYQNGNCSFGGCEGTTDVLNAYTFRMIREFNTNSKFVRFGVEGGLSFVSYKPAEIINNNSTNNSSGNYSSGNSSGSSYFNGSSFFGTSFSAYGNNNPKKSENTSMGLSLRAKVAFPLTTFTGLELAAISNINRFQSYVGAELYLIIGLIRGK